MMKNVVVGSKVLLGFIGLSAVPVWGQLPPDFPAITVSAYDSNKVAEGHVFLASLGLAPGSQSYVMILDNTGTPVDTNKYAQIPAQAFDFKVQPNGLISYAEAFGVLPYQGSWDAHQRIVDETVTNVVDTYRMRNGYVAEIHDFQLLPNGHALLLGYYGSDVDLSQIVAGGHPAALVAGAVIQELDRQRNPVFQWRSWDYFEFADDSYNPPANAVHTKFHINNVNMDSDGHIIAGTPREIYKINRQSGEVIWTLGGPDNEFTVVGGEPEHFGGHGTYRLENGNFLMYDNSDGVTTSRVHEYSLDEVNKIATWVWSYVPPVPILCQITGNAQRLSNGNTFICWGGFRSPGEPVCSEVTPAGEVVFELALDDVSLQSYRAFRFPYPASTQQVGDVQKELSAGNEYAFPAVGITLDVDSLSSGGYNQVELMREPYAPIAPAFITLKAPRLLPWRVTANAFGITSMTADIEFDVSDFGLSNPSDLTVYHRETPGDDVFVPLTTTYNPVTSKVIGTMTRFGEFVLGYPDLADIANPPILCQPESYRGEQTNAVVAPAKAESHVLYTVNQELPVALCWSPKGLSRFSRLQVAIDPTFSTLVVDVPYATQHTYVLSNALPDTVYHWRVQSQADDGSLSDWATSTFRTVPPAIQVTAPNGGDLWQRGLEYFIAWDDNIDEEVSIALYKAGAFLEFITTNAPSRGAYEWEPGFHLSPGNDYSIRITSTVDGGLTDASDANFNLDVPRLTGIQRELDGAVVLEWAGTSAGVYVDFAISLAADAWVPLAGPLFSSSWTNVSPPSVESGHYRLRLE